MLEYLTQYYKVTLLWYNPNIWPPEENDKRLHYQRKIINALGLKEDVSIVIPDYDHDRYLQMVSGLESEPEGGLRCTECFRMRLKEAAEKGLPGTRSSSRPKAGSSPVPAARPSLQKANAEPGLSTTAADAGRGGQAQKD